MKRTDIVLVLLIAVGVGVGYLAIRHRIVREVRFTWTPDRWAEDRAYQVFAIFPDGTWPLSEDVALPNYVLRLKGDQDHVAVALRPGMYMAGVQACSKDGGCHGWGHVRFTIPGAGDVKVETSHLWDDRFR